MVSHGFWMLSSVPIVSMTFKSGLRTTTRDSASPQKLVGALAWQKTLQKSPRLEGNEPQTFARVLRNHALRPLRLLVCHRRTCAQVRPHLARLAPISLKVMASSEVSARAPALGVHDHLDTRFMAIKPHERPSIRLINLISIENGCKWPI